MILMMYAKGGNVNMTDKLCVEIYWNYQPFMRLWVFKRHFSTIFQLYIDLWATFPGANMVQGRNTLGVPTLKIALSSPEIPYV
jgi:hypothetical protein